MYGILEIDWQRDKRYVLILPGNPDGVLFKTKAAAERALQAAKATATAAKGGK